MSALAADLTEHVGRHYLGVSAAFLADFPTTFLCHELRLLFWIRKPMQKFALQQPLLEFSVNNTFTPFVATLSSFFRDLQTLGLVGSFLFSKHDAGNTAVSGKRDH